MSTDADELPSAADAPTLEALAQAYVQVVRAREAAARAQAARLSAPGGPKRAVTFAPVKLGNDTPAARATNRAFELYKMRHDEDAEAALDAVLAGPTLPQPVAVRAHVRRALARTRRGALDEARADLEAALALAPNDGPAHYDLALVALRAGADDAEQHLTAAFAADPVTYRKAVTADPDFDPYRALVERVLRAR